MKKYALIGENISYTLSPLIHSVIYEKTGIEASYDIIDCKREELPVVVEKLKEYDGFNITKPHKQNILPYLQNSELKSVNTVAISDGKFYGYSTDGYGFSRDLKLKFGNVSGTALVLGAGGVAGVIVKELIKLGVKVYITNRTQERAEALAAETGATACKLDEIAPDLIVNCTSCGYNEGENPASKGGLTKNGLAVKTDKVKWVYDTIYAPPETELLKSFPLAQRSNGFGMLILQGVEADRIMCGVEIDDDTEAEIYRTALERITKQEKRK
jgi:shikimate dehydrogenase